MSERGLSLAAQEELVAGMLRVARQLEADGDPYLLGQYMHLRERIESLLRIIESNSAPAA